MAVKSVRRRPIGTNPNTVVDPDAWVRPSDWLALPTPTAHQMVGLFAVYNDDTQYLALNATAASNYTVDWGDGTVDNWTSATTASHTYNYTTLSSAVSSRGYKMAIVKVYPQSGTMTALNITGVKHPSLVSTNGNYSYNWLDIWINGASLTTLTIGTSSIGQAPKVLEQVRIDAWAKTSYASQFFYCTKLQSVILANSSGTVTSTVSMFTHCDSLKTVPLFNTASVTDMTTMFNSCSSLPTVPLFNTASVITMNSMFNACTSLQTVPLFNTVNVTNMASMFQTCPSLKSVPLFNTASVTDMSTMFNACSSLTTVPLFNTVNVTNMTNMFNSNFSLVEVPLFNTANVTTMLQMFLQCYSLKTIPAFNTVKVTNMQSMVNGCWTLESFPTLDCSALTVVTALFNACYSLNTVGTLNFTKASSAANYATIFNNTTYQLSTVALTLPYYSVSFINSKLSVTALNTIFTNLPTNTATVSSASGSGTVVTFTTSAAHTFKVGNVVSVTGLLPAGYNVTSLAIASVPTATTFTVANTTTGTSTGVGVATVATQTITVTGNPGAATCTTSIATAKGWTVTV